MNCIEKYESLSGDLLESHGTRLAFFKGSHKPDLLIVGEAPGSEENFQGRPFVGPSGNLLDQLIVDGGLSDSRVARLFVGKVLVKDCQPLMRT